ncbi:MAG TPA: hypothetical protein PKW05_08960 [Anaerolineae bacterium]|nr:hypothetical protein [Anaerolineae bacterium]HQJ51889.1 hypothetical protein [Anaerolineae bacterium]
MPIGWLQNRQRTKEIERDIKARHGRARVKTQIARQKDLSKRLWSLAKQALQLNNKGRFRQVAVEYMRTLANIDRGENALFTFDLIEARRDQARATADFLAAIRAMSESMLASASVQGMAETQHTLEMGISRAKDMEERMSYILDMAGETFASSDEFSEEELGLKLGEIEKAMATEAEHEEGTGMDERIESGIKRIEEELRKELK